MKKDKQIQIGGQAVIEGVMMRSPEYITIAVRKSNGKIALKKDRYISWTKRIKILGLPFIRGGVILIESLILGIKALNFSSNIALSDLEQEKSNNDKHDSTKYSKFYTAITVIFALVLSIGLFFYLPLILTELIGAKSGILFNLIDGAIRLTFFLIYILLISMWKEIRRVFEYHGAEHKSIFAYESGNPLTLKDAQSFSTHHPRCGTSFLLIVMLVALIVFIILGRPQDITDRLIRFLFIPIIGGISYEIIRLSGKKNVKKLIKIIVTPGLLLQKITTQEPDEKQLEVALIALKAALNQDYGKHVELVSNN
jgi:uncharacterized protein YqhQ